MKKFLSFIILTIIIIACPISPALASDMDNPQREAMALKELGIFLGREDGFALEEKPNRIEASIVLLRLLGKEDEAISKRIPHPFQDVPQWASPQIGWLYQKGLVNGVNANKFDNSPITNWQMMTMLLRALGYNDSNGDFQYKNSLTKALELNIITPQRYKELTNNVFNRRQLSLAIYDSLQAKYKASSQTLLYKLMKSGAISRRQINNTGLIDLEKAVGFRNDSVKTYTLQQLYTFKLTDTKENKLDMTVALPGTYLNHQEIISHSFSSQPKKIYNKDGVTYADFSLTNLSQNLTITINSKIQTIAYDLQIAANLRNGNLLSSQEKAKYLLSDKFIDWQNPLIQKQALNITGQDQLAKVNNIYNFVVNHMTYVDTEDIYSASQALTNKKGDCFDYTLLMTALCRANNIPTRICSGFLEGYNNAGHAWVEVYLDKYGWVPMDTVNGDENSAYSRMDNNYLYLSNAFPNKYLDNNTYLKGYYYGGNFSYNFNFIK
ncbi:MAG: transglutaminase-like domain-containing protein [Clostridiales bacterium]